MMDIRPEDCERPCCAVWGAWRWLSFKPEMLFERFRAEGG